MLRLGVEDRLQKSIVDWLRLCAPGTVVFAVPNEGKRSFAQQARHKALGMLKGVTDLVLVTGRGVYFIEVKGPKGRTTPEQDDFMSWCRSLGHGTAVVRSLDDVRLALKAWGIATRDIVDV